MKPVTAWKAIVTCILLFCTMSSRSQTTIFDNTTSWKYLNDGTDQGTSWYATAFNDGSWSSSNAQFHVGESGNTNLTTLRQTTYYRKSFTITGHSGYDDFTANLVVDDGAVIYVNGVEVARQNMPTGTIAYATTASAQVNGGSESTVNAISIAASYFIEGTNVIAVEVHQASNNGSDTRFQMQLIGNPVAAGTLIPYNSSWNYLVSSSAAPSDWKDVSFSGSWSSGYAELGYGDGGEATTLGYGADANNKYPTTYFRKNFTVSSLTGISYFTINAIRDDGIVVYVNGQEVGRNNMPAGAVSYSTFATAAIGGTDETTAISFTVNTSYFTTGTNTIAVELHQSDAASTDISFNLELVSVTVASATLTRSPYLQVGTQNSVTIRWKSDVATDSKVDIGSAAGSYTSSITDPTLTTDHSVTVTGLTADTKYFYQVGSSAQVLQGAAENFFTTVPPSNTTRKMRIAAFGDCGRNDNSFRTLSLQHYQAYLSTNGYDAADALILLGDNAYSNGLETEYVNNFFTPMAGILKNHKLYPSPGNHDYYAANQSSRSHPYYNNFTMPTNAECGGVASGTEAFYSFDIGNVHFLSLDSYGHEAGSTRLYDTLGPQVTWIKNDLAVNTKKWTIAYFHHPPYTKGSHNSDTETELINIRNNFIRILERYGVDMIICGHSHDYERSYLLQGHYGIESTFSSATHAKSSSSARYDGSASSCPYVTASDQQNHGTVYVVAGSSGADGGIQSGYPHDAFPFSQDDGGMFYFEVDDNRLDAKFIRRDGVIADRFTIVQDANRNITYDIITGQSVTLSASWPGTYVWNTSATTRGITVTPPAGNTVYTVNDLSSGTCLTDIITVRAAGILPVDLSRFNVSLKRDKVFLDWTTSSEQNSKSFTVERSLDGSSFDPLVTVAAAGNSTAPKNYGAIDESPLKGTSFYRLKQNDIDGNIKISEIRKIVNTHGRVFDMKLGIKGNEVSISFVSTQSTKVILHVYDMAGRTVATKNWTLSVGSTQEQIRLPKGSYILNFTAGGNDPVVKKIVID